MQQNMTNRQRLSLLGIWGGMVLGWPWGNSPAGDGVFFLLLLSLWAVPGSRLADSLLFEPSECPTTARWLAPPAPYDDGHPAQGVNNHQPCNPHGSPEHRPVSPRTPHLHPIRVWRTKVPIMSAQPQSPRVADAARRLTAKHQTIQPGHDICTSDADYPTGQQRQPSPQHQTQGTDREICNGARPIQPGQMVPIRREPANSAAAPEGPEGNPPQAPHHSSTAPLKVEGPNAHPYNRPTQPDGSTHGHMPRFVHHRLPVTPHHSTQPHGSHLPRWDHPFASIALSPHSWQFWGIRLLYVMGLAVPSAVLGRLIGWGVLAVIHAAVAATP